MLPKLPAEERAMTPAIKSYPLVDKVIDIFGDWLKHRREIREMRELDAGEFTRIAHELCVSPDDLDTFVRHGPHATDELPKLLKALGIDENALARSQPLVLRDMERVCASCVRKAQCDQDLDAGTSDQHYEEYCLNASTIDAPDQSRSRTGRDAISAANMSQGLTADVDAWAEAHETVRSNAIRQLAREMQDFAAFMAEGPWFSLRILASRETARKYALWDAGERLDPPNYEPGKPCSRLSRRPEN
jgi:hypothetical protein